MYCLSSKQAPNKAPNLCTAYVANKAPNSFLTPSKNKPQSSHIVKICLWTKFQPPTHFLAPPGPVFLFQPKNYFCRWCYPKITQPGLHTVLTLNTVIEKICLWTKFQPPRSLPGLSVPVFQICREN